MCVLYTCNLLHTIIRSVRMYLWLDCLLKQLVAQCSCFNILLLLLKIQLDYPTVVVFYSIGKHIFFILKGADIVTDVNKFSHLVIVTYFTGSFWHWTSVYWDLAKLHRYATHLGSDFTTSSRYTGKAIIIQFIS